MRSFTIAEEDQMVKVRDIRKRLLSLFAMATLAGAMVLSPSADSRASDIGVRMGYYFDANAFSIGTELLTPIGDHPGEWYFNPNLELAMGDTDVAALNADFHYDLDTNSNAAFWVGAGPALLIRDHARVADDTDVDPALNLIMGLGAKHGSYRPFIQGKGILSDNSEAALAVGIRF